MMFNNNGTLIPKDQWEGDSSQGINVRNNYIAKNGSQYKLTNKVKLGAATSTNFMKNNGVSNQVQSINIQMIRGGQHPNQQNVSSQE